MKSKLLAVVLLISVSWVAQSEMTLDSVLADYIEAKGGMEVIKGTKTIKTTGKMTMGAMEAPFTFIFKSPNKIYTTFELQGMKGIQAFDGEKGWQVMPFMGKTEPVAMSEDELKQIKEQADLEGPLVDHESKGIQLELIGNTEIEGTPVIEIKATKPSGDVVTVFLDKEYMIEVMTRTKMNMMGQEVEAETYFSDYKEVGESGYPMAHAMSVKMNGSVVQNLTFEDVALNVDVDDSLFQMPVETEQQEAAE
ncbi:hypothetical protein GCM10011365_07300 [Marinicella pacifica]|uniref:Outer membrane lipoprotein-sorting protein n=1 Tax=Marinicella pacifica TaxID=1171543 RepID=A0A917CHH2_9GAMM|nr:hypothetical protein [Marinicella pacifica]GGF88664.1 hypothetical protein GCM10011365_07300 [Marinicella pacifica]